MKWIADDTQHSGYRCVIEFDSSDVGYYLYVWKNGVNVADHLQDTLEIAMEQARADYGIAPALWRQVSH